jgi:hypothetical protein
MQNVSGFAVNLSAIVPEKQSTNHETFSPLFLKNRRAN